MEEVDAPGLEDDEGKAKSEDDVGRYGRVEAFGMAQQWFLTKQHG